MRWTSRMLTKAKQIARIPARRAYPKQQAWGRPGGRAKGTLAEVSKGTTVSSSHAEEVRGRSDL